MRRSRPTADGARRRQRPDGGRRSGATAPRKCAIDIALHDLAGKVLGSPVHDAARPAGRSAADRLHDRHRRASRRRGARCDARPTFPALKIKCGGPADLATLRAVREVFAGPIRVDANTGWTRADAETLLPALVDLGVELIEQPFPARAYRDLALAPGTLARCRSWPTRARVPTRTSTRSSASSRASTSSSRSAAASGRRGRCSSALASSGSGRSSAAWRRRRSASPPRRSSASLAEWVDLDGNLLLADDPFEGLELGPDKRWRLSEQPGLGSGPRGPRRPATGVGSCLNRCRHVPHACSANARSCGQVGGRSRGQAPFRRCADGPTMSRIPAAERTQGGSAGTPGDVWSDRPSPGRLTSRLDSSLPEDRARVGPLEPPHAQDRREGTPSMDLRTAATRVPDPDAVEFIRFCYRRRRVGWPELYDEMCAVAARGLFRGLVRRRSRRPRDRLQPLRHAGARSARDADRGRGAGGPAADDGRDRARRRGGRPPRACPASRDRSQPSWSRSSSDRRSSPVLEVTRHVRFVAVPAGA